MASISRWINSWFASTLEISIFLATTRHHSKKFLQNSNLIEASGPEGIIERKNLLNFDTSKKMNQHGNMWGIHFSTTAVRKEVRKKEFLNLYAVYGQKKISSKNAFILYIINCWKTTKNPVTSEKYVNKFYNKISIKVTKECH